MDQAETALGADMRRKDEKKGKPATKSKGGPSIVHRELKTILTTGTIVDGNLLTDDLSNHCIAIKEYLPDSTSNPRFGVVIADCSTAEFTLSAFEVSCGLDANEVEHSLSRYNETGRCMSNQIGDHHPST